MGRRRPNRIRRRNWAHFLGSIFGKQEKVADRASRCNSPFLLTSRRLPVYKLRCCVTEFTEFQALTNTHPTYQLHCCCLRQPGTSLACSTTLACSKLEVLYCLFTVPRGIYLCRTISQMDYGGERARFCRRGW